MSAPVTRPLLHSCQGAGDDSCLGCAVEAVTRLSLARAGKTGTVRQRAERHLAHIRRALASIEAEAMADREHLEEGARLLAAMINGDQVDETDIDIWEDAERARRAKT